jgi:NodT family efflux transporter outer membrane factor (OMF) lipoprotein
LAALLACTLASCAVGPNFHSPAAPRVQRYSSEDPVTTAAAHGVAQQLSGTADVAADWWKQFHSAALEGIVTDALHNNPGLEAAEASLRASQNTLRSGYGIFFPAIDAAAGAARERFAPASLGESAAGSVFNLFTLGATVSYALDLFGGQRRLVEELRAQVDVSRAEERAAYLALTSNVVNSVIAEAAYRAEVQDTRRLIDLQTEQVRIAEVQFTAGTQPYSAVLALRSQLAASQAAVPQLEQKLAQTEDLLAALSGTTPGEWRDPGVGLDDLQLPAELPVSVPSALVRHRPDVMASEATAHAASAAIGVATAAMLPSVTLTGSFERLSNKADVLFPKAGRAWSAGADASAPLFQGGTLWFRRKAALDAYAQATALYRQAVLAAFEQVADALRALDHDASALAAQDEALDAARQALRLTQANYAAGIAGYLDVLNADAQLQQSEIANIQALALRYQDTVALYAALGGGWWNAPPESAGNR